MSSKSENIVCMRHPHYDGLTSPDLSCKFCCSKFVGAIRSQQNDSFQALSNSNRDIPKNSFSELTFKKIPSELPSKRSTHFDGSWI